MLDKKTESVLALLLRKANDEYKVLDKSDLANELPARLKQDVQSVTVALAYLKEKGYITVKYQDKDEICLCTAPKAKTYFEKEKKLTPETKIINAQMWLLLAGVLAASFLGALAAVTIGKIL